jgi:MFS family permease
LRSPWFAVVVLFGMNLLNYIDRYVFFSAGPKISEELTFSDSQFGILSIAFMVVYTIVSPFVGWLGDRYNRPRLIAFGVALWSLATVGTAFSSGFYDMFFWRALLGIGEASYGVIAPALLADLFPPKRRGPVMGLYYLALPLGGAIGYLVGGWFAAYEWRHAFYVVGIPGMVAAFAGLLMHDPGRGASEGRPDLNAVRPKMSDYLEMLITPSFLWNTAGQAAVTFAIGAYAVWGSTFYQRVRGFDSKEAGAVIGAITAGAGLFGIIVGTWISDRWSRYSRRALLFWPGVAVLLAAPMGTMAILAPERTVSLGFLFAASLLMASVLGPSNTVTANVVAANRRAAGYAMCIFLVHLFGDISSPALVGAIADHFGTPAAAESSVGRFFASIGAVPTLSPTGPSNLTLGMLIVVPTLVLGAFCFFLGARTLPRDQDRAQSAPGGSPIEPGGFVGH